MEGKFFPAIWASDFQDSRAALRSIGIVDHEADFCLAGIVVGPDQPAIFEALIDDPRAILSDHPLSKSAIVLMATADGLVGLWFGMFEYLSDTREEAMQRYISDVIDEMVDVDDEAPTVDVFQWTQPKVVMQ